MPTDPTDFSQLKDIDRSILFRWILRIARSVERRDEYEFAKEANNVLERFVLGHNVPDEELSKITFKTFNRSSWAAYCTETASRIAIQSKYPNTVFDNEGDIVTFVPYLKGNARQGGLHKIVTWDQHISSQFAYPVQWALNTHLRQQLAKEMYLDWLKEFL